MKNKIIETKILNNEIDIFSCIDLEKTGITKLTKSDLLELIKIINKIAIDSSEFWDGG